MFKSTALILLFALLCIFKMHDCEAYPTENNAQNTIQELYAESAKKVSDVFEQIKEATEKSAWTEEAKKFAETLKGMINASTSS